MVKRYRVYLLFLFLLTLLLCCLLPQPLLARSSPQSLPLSSPTISVSPSIQSLLDQSKLLYEQGQFAEAAHQLEQVVQQTSTDPVTQAIALSNLSLVYQELGQWERASQTIQESLNLLNTSGLPYSLKVQAQALDILGKLQLTRGQAEVALDTFQQAIDRFTQLQDWAGVTRSTINQVTALRSIGSYQRAISTLKQLTRQLQDQPATVEQVVALRSLGDALRVSGDLDASMTVLQQSFRGATELQLPDAIAATQLSLGNTAYARAATLLNENTVTASNAQRLALQTSVQTVLQYYRQAATGTAATQIQAQLNQLRLYLEVIRLLDPAAHPSHHKLVTEAWTALQSLIPQLSTQLDRLPPGRTALYAQINFARRLTDLWFNSDHPPTFLPRPLAIAQRLALAQQQAVALQDKRAESFALGNLGNLYERMGQFQDAEPLTRQALQIAQTINALDIAYQWQWQLGRLMEPTDRAAAIAAYQGSVDALQLIRSDIAANPDIQFSFRQQIEPIYRQLVSLLLPVNQVVSPENLEQARKAIESLQTAELDNFFRQACLNQTTVILEEIDQEQRSAVLYPIILPDRLEVILQLPNNQVIRYSHPEVSQYKLQNLIDDFSVALRQERANYLARSGAQQLYEWLIKPAESVLDQNVETLVFVLDGPLRNIPMAVLYDADKHEYLIEKKYNIALAPGLQLLSTEPLQRRSISVFLAGISQAVGNFPPLQNVETEFQGIQAAVRTNEPPLLDKTFQYKELLKALEAVPFPVVHLATHGEFSSQLDRTFIQAWDQEIKIPELYRLLQASELSRRQPIELLVLSACQTAEGDDRAALGLAGVAMRAGARSTVATLWQVDDAATSNLMKKFYQELASRRVRKAEALRRAQLSLLQDTENSRYQNPYYWAAVVLVGDWQ